MIMDLQLAKLELIEMLLNTKREAVLKKVKMLLETEQDDFSLTEEQYKVIDKRREAYLKGEGKSFTWEQVKQNALNAIS
jgi:phosphoribosylanthranilate isomerase